jgi:hypothetical protein
VGTVRSSISSSSSVASRNLKFDIKENQTNEGKLRSSRWGDRRYLCRCHRHRWLRIVAVVQQGVAVLQQGVAHPIVEQLEGPDFLKRRLGLLAVVAARQRSPRVLSAEE